ncbi:calcium-binding protein [Flavobacterium adhaerens]|uniref:calcium-binding protein n=1 Tax=Flavobacterium adhaerens TaxID=3149043 RepID=UPI0032B380F9
MNTTLRLITISLFFVLSPLRAQQGKVDTSFNTFDDGTIGEGFDGNVRVIIENTDGTSFVAGDFLNFNGISATRILKLNVSGDKDSSFSSGTGFDNLVTSGFKTITNQLVYGGSFTNYNGISKSRLLRLNLDGTLDLSFNSGNVGPDNIVQAMAQFTDGSILVAGDAITNYNEVAVNNVFKINANGILDVSFNANITLGAAGAISKIIVQPDGKIVICGSFTSFNGTTTRGLTRLNADGTVDATFNSNLGTGADNNILALDLQSDGKLILGGAFTSFNGTAVGRITRLNADGTIDTSFNNAKSGFSNGIVQVVRSTNDGIYVAGSFTGNYNGIDSGLNRLTLLSSNGDLNADFVNSTGLPSCTFYTIEKAVDGQIYIGGSFTTYDKTARGRLAKIDKNGNLDTEFLSNGGVGANANVLKLIPLASGKTMIFGSFTSFNGIVVNRIARLNEDGSLDTSFNIGGLGVSNTIRTAVELTDGSFVIGGNFTSYNGITIRRILKIKADGTVDSNFNPVVIDDGGVYALAVDADGKILVGGSFTLVDNVAQNRLIRLNGDGSIDTGFFADVDNTVQAIALETTSNKIVLGGNFTSYNSIPVSKLVRINNDGSLDTSYNNTNGPNNTVHSLARQSDGKLLVGGSFTTFEGTPKRRFLRITNDGHIDTSFLSGNGFNNANVRTITVQPDDRIILGGLFNGTFTGTDGVSYPVRRIVRLNGDGSYNSSFTTTLNNACYTSAIDFEGRILVGGSFSSVGGKAKYRIARILGCVNNSTYNASGWTRGLPDKRFEVAIEENLMLNSDTHFCNCSVSSGKKLSVENEKNLSLEFEFYGNSTTLNGIITFESGTSLLQNDENAVNTGSIVYKRTVSGIKDKDYVYWSSPVVGQTLGDFSSDSEKFYSWYVSNWAVASSGTIMKPGKGYIVLVPPETPGPDINLEFTGEPNNGEQKIASQGINKNNLIGNPYPSAIDAEQFMIDNQTLIGGTLNFWTHNTAKAAVGAGDVYVYSSGDYASFNGTGGTTAKSGGAKPDGAIVAGQSFMVKSTGEGDFVFNNALRVSDSGSNTTFYKQTKTKVATEVEKNRVWLNFSNNQGAFKQLLVGYVQGATNSIDNLYDGETLNGNAYVDFYSINNSKNLTIQGRGLPFDTSDIVPLGYKTTIEGIFQISIDEVDGVLVNQGVYLEDKMTNTVHNLKEGSYSFTTTIGTFNDRFVLKYTESNSSLGTDDNEIDAKGAIVSVKNHRIKINSFDQSLKTVKVYDLKGSLLFDKNKLDSKEFIIDQLNAADQIMIVMVQLENGKWMSKEIVFH